MDFSDLLVDFQNEVSGRLTEDWTWLIGRDKKVVMVSIIGDMFLMGTAATSFGWTLGKGNWKWLLSTKWNLNENSPTLNK